MKKPKSNTPTKKAVFIKAGKHDYPPDKQKKATKTVLEQAELIARNAAN